MSDELREKLADWLAVPVLVVFDVGETLAFEGLRDDSCWFLGGGSRGVNRVDDFLDVVTVNDDGVPAEGLETCSIDVGLVAEGSSLGLTESVHVN